MNKQELQQSLGSLAGWKKVARPFLIIFGNAKKSYQKWQTATEKGVVDCHVLAKYEYEDNNYYIIAYTPNGTIAPDVIKKLKAEAEAFDIDAVRYGSSGTDGLKPWIGYSDADRDDSYIRDLSIPEKGIFVESVAIIDEQDTNIPYVIYAKLENEYHVCAVPDHYLN